MEVQNTFRDKNKVPPVVHYTPKYNFIEPKADKVPALSPISQRVPNFNRIDINNIEQAKSYYQNKIDRNKTNRNFNRS